MSKKLAGKIFWFSIFIFLSACGNNGPIAETYAFGGGGYVVPPECAIGYFRVGLNYCQAYSDNTSKITVDGSLGCTLSAPWANPPANAKLINLGIVTGIIATGTTATLDTALIHFYQPTDTACSGSIVNGNQFDVYEQVTGLSGTIGLQQTEMKVWTNSNGQFYYEITAPTPLTQYTLKLRGYWQ